MAQKETWLKLLRWFVFGLNLFFWLAGLGTLGIALWLRFDPEVTNYMSANTELEDFYTGVYLLLAVGVLMTLLGFLGCCGALRESQSFLVAVRLFFFLLLVLVFVGELAGAILAFQHQDRLKHYIENSMYDTVYVKYGSHQKYTRMFDVMQESLECCGVHQYKDWLHSSYVTQSRTKIPERGVPATGVGPVPRSCCNAMGLIEYPGRMVQQPNGDAREMHCGESFDAAPLWTYEPYLHPNGCAPALYERVYGNLNVVIAIAVIIGSLQLFGMVISMVLCCAINYHNEQDRKTGGYY